MTSCHLSGTLYCSLTFQLYITVHFGAICTIVNLGLIEFGEKIGEFLTLCFYHDHRVYIHSLKVGSQCDARPCVVLVCETQN